MILKISGKEERDKRKHDAVTTEKEKENNLYIWHDNTPGRPNLQN